MATSSTPPIWLRAISDPRVSKVMHRLVTTQPPAPVLEGAIRTFSRLYGVNLEESAKDVSEFDSFQAFFTRKLKEGERTIEDNSAYVPSPADGKLSAFGELGEGTLVQAKGVEYSLDALVGDSSDADAYRHGSYAVVYLAPYNYHRVHCAWQGKLTSWRYLPGALYPVNEMGLRHVPGLFARNERLIGHFDTEFGRAAMIMVGATFVGHMSVVFSDLKTNAGTPASGRVLPGAPVPFERGQEFGIFEMGSTVVMLFERSDLTPAMPLGTPIRMGQAALKVAQ
ncbi:MAG: phosphatidylserine decarboxylase [Myxococcales bacterium]|nr:phosphatidylserine decarboxylase [Myxococcales bacterium]